MHLGAGLEDNGEQLKDLLGSLGERMGVVRIICTSEWHL